MTIDLQKIIKENKKLKKKRRNSFLKKLEKEIKSKRILKKEQVSVNIPDYNAPSVLEDENRFFTGEFNREKKRLFFS